MEQTNAFRSFLERGLSKPGEDAHRFHGAEEVQEELHKLAQAPRKHLVRICKKIEMSYNR